MSCPHATSLLSLLFAAAVLAQEPQVTATPRLLPVDAITVLGEERWITARIVDAIDGKPVVGAEVLLVAESQHPIRGEFAWSMRATADTDGFVALRIDKAAPGYVPWGWVVVRAPGHAPVMTMGAPDGPLVRLPRAITMPVRICDRLGQPVADALVGFCGGCGHTPDLVHSRTDAAGIVRLADVDRFSSFADLYIEHPDLHLGYADAHWFPGEGPFDFFVRPGVSSRGIVVDAAGQPIADAYVGSKDVHRGPWTRTGADGSFALHGSESASDLFVRVGKREVLLERPTTTPMRLQLPESDREPPPTAPRTEADRERTALVLFRVLMANGHDVPNASVRCIGPLPALDEAVSDSYDGGALLTLRYGRYTVLARGDGHTEVHETVDVTRDGDNDFTLRPTPVLNGDQPATEPSPTATAAPTALVYFRVHTATGQSVAHATVRCIGPLPSRAEVVCGPFDGGETLVLPQGRYEVVAGGDDHAELREVLEVAEITPERNNDFTLRPVRLPSVVVRIPDPPDYLMVDLVTAKGSRDIAPLVRQGAPVALPDEPFHIVLHSYRSRRAFAPDRTQALAAGVLRLRWFSPTHVEGQLVDARGEQIAAKVALLGVGSFDAEEFAKLGGTQTTGAVALVSDDVGLQLLTVLADGRRYPRIVPVVLPPRGDDVVVDVGTIVVGGAPRLLLQDADGEAPVDAKASLLRPGWSDMNEGGLAFPVDAGGEWFGPDPQAGDAIVVAARAIDPPATGALPERDLDVRFPITGQGPWTLRLPGGELDIDVRDESGKALTANVFVGSECIEFTAPTRLRRLSPGPQRLFVAADGHQSAIVDITVPTAGRAAVKVVLPKR